MPTISLFYSMYVVNNIGALCYAGWSGSKLHEFGDIHFIRVLIAADLLHDLASHQWLHSPFLHAFNKPVTAGLDLALVGKGIMETVA